MSSYRLTLPGLLLGMAGGVFYWSQTVEDPQTQLLAGQLAIDQWLVLTLAVAIGGLLLGLCFMILDALANFTRVSVLVEPERKEPRTK